MLPAINLRWGHLQSLTPAPKRPAPKRRCRDVPVPRCPSAEKSQRRNGERQNRGAEMVAPKWRRRNVTYRESKLEGLKI